VLIIKVTDTSTDRIY